MQWMNAGTGMSQLNDNKRSRSKGSEPEVKGPGVTQIVWNPSIERQH